nr:uncharacterized mitochondrial protein AtMg00810-like [Tanacetum cinerariifolium]
ATLHIDGQSIEVDVPPYIIDVVEEDDDITDDEDALPYDLADSDNEDLINVDDDFVDKVYSSEDAAKQGRRTDAIDADEDITLVSVQDDADKEMFALDVLGGEEMFVAGQNEMLLKKYLMLLKEDLEDLYKLVKARYGSTRPVESMDHLLWSDLKTIFEPHIEDEGKENGVNILKSIDEGPFRMGTLRETLSEGTKGALHLGPKRPRVYSDLTYEEKERVVVQNVQGRQNRGQGNNARGAGAASYGGAQNRVGYANLSQARQIKCYNYNGIGHLERNCTQPKRPQNSKYFKDKMLLMKAQENRDLALNVDNVFQADDCDAFDSDVDEAPIAQTTLMANLSSAGPVYDEVGPSYDSDILSEDNAVPAVQSNVSSVLNDAYTMILNNMHEYPAQHISVTTENNIVDKSLTAELATYKEQVELYKRRARFELTEIEQKINEQLRIVITDRNIKEENLKKPDIVHATCLCARYQAKKTEKHLKEVKSIFHYLRGTVNTGLGYTKDSGFELTGFSDADYAGCKHTFKSTSGGAQFLGEILRRKANTSLISSFDPELEGSDHYMSYLALSTNTKVNVPKVRKGGKGKGLMGKKKADVSVQKEKKKNTVKKNVVVQKKKSFISAEDNIMPNLDEALKLESEETEDDEVQPLTRRSTCVVIACSSSAFSYSIFSSSAFSSSACSSLVFSLLAFSTSFISSLDPIEVEIQSMVDVPIHQENPAIQRTPLVDIVISMVTENTTPTPSTILLATKAQVSNDDDVPKKDNSVWFKQDARPKTPDQEWHKEPNADDAPKQTWFHELVTGDINPITFNDLMDSTIDFTKFSMHHLKKDKSLKQTWKDQHIIYSKEPAETTLNWNTTLSNAT